MSQYEFTLECKSIRGEILMIDKDEFRRKISIITEAMTHVIDKSKEKRFLYYRQVINTKTVQRR